MADSINLKEAKKIILNYIKETLTIKNTKWVEDDNRGYKEVDAGYSKEDMDLLYSLQYRDMKNWYKLRDLLKDLI